MVRHHKNIHNVVRKGSDGGEVERRGVSVGEEGSEGL